MNPIFKIGDTIRVLSRIRLDDGTYLDLTGKTLRSVFKGATQEFLGTTSLIDAFTAQAVFQTTNFPKGKYSTDLRVTDGIDSFASPTVVVTLAEKIS